MKKVILALLIIVMLGAGAVLLAQQADAAGPGDTLYSIDLLAEKVQRALMFDDLKEAEFETAVLGERVAELSTVSTTEDGDVEELLAAVSEQQTRVKDCIGLLEGNPELYQDGELEQIQNQYEQQLQQHIEVVEQVQNKGEDTAIQIKQELEENLESCRSGSCGSTTSGNEDAGSGSESSQQGSSGTDNGNPNN